MQKNSPSIKTARIVLACIAGLLFAVLAVSPFFARAQCSSGAGGSCAQVGNIGGLNVTAGMSADDTPKNAEGYLTRLYNFLLGFIGVAAMGSIVYGGVLYLISAGNPSRVGAAKDAIWNGIIGILVAGFGYLILATINPDLVSGFDLKAVVETNLKKAQQQ